MAKQKSQESSKSSKEETYWQFVERTSDEVAKFPAWKLGGTSSRQASSTKDHAKKDLK